MQAYMTHDGCLMEYLVDLLDDPTAAPCGQCARCRGRGMSRETDPDHVAAAISFLRRDLRPIAPRKQWPAGAVDGLSGKIAPPNEPGLALSVLGDAGWGREVQRGRYGRRRVQLGAGGGSGAGDPGALAPEPATDLGHVRAVRLASRFRRGVRSRACAEARPADRRSADQPARLGTPGVDAELGPAAPERAREARRRRLGGSGRSGPARGRRGRLGLDADGRRRPPSLGGQRPGRSRSRWRPRAAATERHVPRPYTWPTSPTPPTGGSAHGRGSRSRARPGAVRGDRGG